jgi:hypothetical protein
MHSPLATKRRRRRTIRTAATPVELFELTEAADY